MNRTGHQLFEYARRFPSELQIVVPGYRCLSQRLRLTRPWTKHLRNYHDALGVVCHNCCVILHSLIHTNRKRQTYRDAVVPSAGTQITRYRVGGQRDGRTILLRCRMASNVFFHCAYHSCTYAFDLIANLDAKCTATVVFSRKGRDGHEYNTRCMARCCPSKKKGKR